MRGLLVRLRAWYREPTNQFLVGGFAVGALLEWWIQQASRRIVELEGRWPDGMVPLDDVVTIGELERFRAEMEELVGVERPQATEGDAGDAGDD